MDKARLAVVVVALAALAWWLCDVDEPTAPLASPPLPAEATTSTTTAIAEPSVRAPSTTVVRDGTWWSDQWIGGAEEPLVAGERDPSSAVLRGRLTVRQQPWIHPAGVEVRLTRSWLDSVLPVETDGSQRSPTRDEPTTTTDADGCFALRFTPTADELFFVVDATGAWQDFQKVAKQPRAGELLDLGDVWLEQRGGIAGTVVATDGTPVAGIEVRAVDEPLSSLTTGLDDVQDLRSQGLEAWQPNGVLRGGPVPGWVVRRDRALPFPFATTDENGRFVLRHLRPGRHDLFLQPADRGATRRYVGSLRRIQVVAGRTTQVPALLAAEADEVDVRLVDENEVSWANASVSVLHGVHGFGSPAVRTNALGTARLRFQAVARTSLLFAYPDGGPWIVVDAIDHRHRVVTVPRPRPLEIRLFDDGDRALTGGSVRTYVAAPLFRRSDRALPPAMQPQEREPGRYVGQVPCELVVVASVAGYAPAIARLQPDPTMPALLCLKLLPLGTMIVRTRDLDGQPVAGASIRVQVDSNPELLFAGAQWSALGDRRVRLGTTDERGELVVPTWPARFSFQATHPDFAPSAGPQLVPVPGTEVELRLRKKAAIVGTLTRQHQPAPKGFRVRARQYAPEGHALFGNGFLQSQLVVTGDGGTFAFRGLSAGLWELQPELPGVPSANGGQTLRTEFRSQRVVLDDGQELHMVLETEAEPGLPSRLVGTVRRDGINLAGAVVSLRAARSSERDEHDEPSRRRSRWRGARRLDAEHQIDGERSDATTIYTHRCDTDVLGEFRFASLPAAAAIEVTVELPSDTGLQRVHRTTVKPPPEGQVLRCDVELQSTRVLLVCTCDGRPLADEMLRLWRSDASGRETARRDVLLDGNGTADLFDLPAGEWQVRPRSGFGRMAPDRFELRPASTATVDLRLLDR